MREKFWSPRPEVLAYVSGLIRPGARVLEIGPGTIPFAKATHFVDRFKRSPSCDVVDVCREPLPYADKSFDFIYCRHVVEDLYNPFLLLREMSRVGKAGYIETPSPICELSRNVDGGAPVWRGYHHHRYIVWVSGDVLGLVEKSPLVEHLTLPDHTKELEEHAFLWNTYFLWKNEIRFRHFEHDLHFQLYADYGPFLLAAMKAARQSIAAFERTVMLSASAGEARR